MGTHGIQTIRPIRAQVGEVVEIIWRNDEGEILYERHAAPPKDTWRVRLERSLETSGHV